MNHPHIMLSSNTMQANSKHKLMKLRYFEYCLRHYLIQFDIAT